MRPSFLLSRRFSPYIKPPTPTIPTFPRLLPPSLSPSPSSPPSSATRSSPLPLPNPNDLRQIRALPRPIRSAEALIGRRRGMVVAAAAAEDGSPARRLWIRTNGETVFASYSPFFICLAAGDLDVEVFRSYISQDALFLRAFANAYEVAEDCVDDDESKEAISVTRKSVLQRLNKQKPVLEEWGVDSTKEIKPNPATVTYTNFLKETAAGNVGGTSIKIVTPFEKTKIGAYTVGAMLPCLRLYAFLVKEIQVLLDPNDCSHPYKKWIDGQSYTSFEASVSQMEELLDNLSVTLTGDELEIIEKLYRQAMKLEIELFLAQPVTQRTVAPLIRSYIPEQRHFIIFSDFDLTCSVSDSSAILAEIAILTAPKANVDDSDGTIARKSSSDLRGTWHDLSKKYIEDYDKCIENILMFEKAKDFDLEGLCKALEQLCAFEKEANLRVTESRVLNGLNIEDIKRTGKRMNLQDGCPQFFQKIVKKEELNASIHLLSYCWCADLIRAVLSAGSLDAVNLYSNEFVWEGPIATGEIMKKMETPLDKLNTFRDIQKNYDGPDKTFSVYIGDSVGDLLCLLEADVGIVVGSSTSLRKVGSHFGVSFVPLLRGVVDKQKQLSEEGSSPWKRLSGVLYTVSSWKEIHAFINGS